jgi:hypothetical protein
MPAPLAVDKEQVRMLVLEVGVTEAARRTGIDLSTVKQWSARGKWLAHLRPENQPKLPISMQPVHVTGVTQPADALRDMLSDGAKRTKVGLTRYTARMAELAAEGGSLEEAPLLKAVADIHSKMHPEQAGEERVALQFFSITMNQGDEREEKPVVDI